jgi:hypothetical protein
MSTAKAKSAKAARANAPALPTVNLSVPDRRAELNWLKYREQKDYCHRRSEAAPKENHEAPWDALFAIEHVLQGDIGASVHALAAVLMIEIEDDLVEEIPGLHRTALAAIRPQLVGEIAAAADRALAAATEEAA